MACVPNLTTLDINQVYTENITKGFGSVVDVCGTTFNKVGLHTWNGVYNVKDFGAVGDGVADDTAAINLALAQTNVALGGAIYFPRGIYLISSSIVIPHGEILLFGAGKTSSAIRMSAFTVGTILFDIQNKSRVHFRDLAVQTQGSNQIGINYYLCNESTIISCNFKSLGGSLSGSGLVIRCSSGGYNNTIVGCDFENFQTGVVLGNIVDGGGVDGVVANQNFYGCKWTSNNIGVDLVWCNQILFSGCRWEANATYGIKSNVISLGIAGVCVLNGCFEANLTRHFAYSALVSNSSFLNCQFNAGTGDIGPDTSNFFIGEVAVIGGVVGGYLGLGNGYYFRATDGEIGIARINWKVSHAAGAITPTLGTVAPITGVAPYKWVDVIASDGTPCVMPIWKV